MNGKSSVAYKGLLAAGKVIATTAYDLLTKLELIEQAKKSTKKTVVETKGINLLFTQMLCLVNRICGLISMK